MTDQAASPQTTTEETPPAFRWLMLLGVSALYFSFGVTSTSLAPLVAPVLRDLDMSHGAMGSVLGAWQLIYIGSAIPCGALLDRLGPRRALLIGAALIAASGFCRSIAVDHLTLFLAVGLFGLGGPIVSAGAPKVVSLWFKGSERGLAMGLYVASNALGGVVTLALTNSLLMPWLDNDWRLVTQLWAGVVVAAGLIWAVVSAMTLSREKEREMKAAGKPRPQLEQLKELVRIPAIQIVLLMSVGIFMFNHGLNNWLPELLRVGGMTAAEAGYWAAIPTLVGIFGALTIPRLATPERRTAILVGLCIAAGVATLCLHAQIEALLFFGLVLQGIARSSLMTVCVLTLVETKGVGEERAGMASGLFFSAAEVGGVSGPLMLGILFDATGGFGAGLYTLTAICVLLVFAALRLKALSARETAA